MRDEKNQSVAKKLEALSVSALLTLAMSGCAVRQTASARDPGSDLRASAMSRPLAPQATGAEEHAASGPEGTREGIKVHGHWTIKVRDPDGTLATHREFENSLQQGANTIAQVLGRVGTVGAWFVSIGDSQGQGPCLNNTAPSGCLIQESGQPGGGTWVFNTLTLSAPTSGPGLGTLTLAGTFTVANAAQIRMVFTEVLACAPTTAPANCPPISNLGPGSSDFFTGAQITPIAVTVGQLVQVTVVFSFS